MFLFLLKYWKYITAISAFCLIVYGIYHFGYTNGLAYGKTLEIKALADQSLSLNIQCSNQKKITSTIEAKNAKDTNDIDTEFNDSVLRDQKAGLSLVNVTSETGYTEAAKPEFSKPTGVPVSRLELRLLTKKADKIRVDLNSCLDYLDAIN